MKKNKSEVEVETGAHVLVPVSEGNKDNAVTDHCCIGVNLYTSAAVSGSWKGQLASGS